MERRICKDCGKPFVLTDGEIDFYQRKGLHLPKRCEACRGKGKVNRQNHDFTQPVQYDSYAEPYRKKHFNWILTAAILAVLAVLIFVAVTEIILPKEPVDSLQESAAVPSYAAFTAGTSQTATEDSSQDRDSEAQGSTGRIVDSTEESIAAQSSESAKESIPQTSIADTAAGQETGYPQTAASELPQAQAEEAPLYVFRYSDYREEHYLKHGVEMGFSSAEEYEKAASAVVTNPEALHKIEAEDGDDVYYLQSTNEFVIVSTDGYIRTYFYPEDGIAYFNRQ